MTKKKGPTRTVPASEAPATRRVLLGGIDPTALTLTIERLQQRIGSLADLRARADEMRDGAVKIGAQWSSRKTHLLALHTLCCRLIDERAMVARRLTRHTRILTSLLTRDVHELPDVDRASQARALTLVGAISSDADRLSEVSMVSGGAR